MKVADDVEVSARCYAEAASTEVGLAYDAKEAALARERSRLWRIAADAVHAAARRTIKAAR
jgi:hypothetical protein